ncbi:Similar to Liph: Lipase member H (Rattus norvegicus), partial [Cotesia congregata]
MKPSISSFDSAEIKSFPIYEPENIYRNVDAAKPSVMFLHSYNESPFNITIRAVIGAYLERGTDNVLLLDWTDLASRPYWPLLPKLKDISRFIKNFYITQNLLSRSIFDIFTNNNVDSQLQIIKEENDKITAGIKIKIYTGYNLELATTTDIPINEPEIIYHYIDNTKPLVIIIANTLDRLIKLGLDLDTFHLIGHSMGAQMAGFVGKYSKYTLPRITGLDPAGPGFYFTTAEHINDKSAKFVDILHTDGGFYGALENTDLCNHWRSWRIYAESIKDPYAFPAVKCPSYRDYSEGNCKNNDV